MEKWEEIICESTTVEWIAVKMIQKFSEHRNKYPGFDIDRAAQYFADTPVSEHARMCYTATTSLTKSIRIHDKRRRDAEYEEFNRAQCEESARELKKHKDFFDGSENYGWM